MYSKKQLEEFYENDINKLCAIFIESGFTNDKITEYFNVMPKEEIIKQAMRLQVIIDNNDNELKDAYTIPEKYKKAEAEFLQDDRNQMYDTMNNTIDEMTGKTLETLYDYESDKYYIGIHRTASPFDEVFEKGIEYQNGTDIHDHVQIFKNFPFMLHQIKHCGEYKMSNGSFIVKVPKTSIEGNINDATPLYYRGENGKVYLRPEYIAAYVPVYNQKIGKVIMNDSPHNNLYTEDTEFFYDERLEKNMSYGFINILLVSIVIIFVTLFIILK